MTEETPQPKIEYDQFGFVKDYVCPSCGAKLRLDHEDDIGTKFFKCEKCGEQTAKPKSEARRRLEEGRIERTDIIELENRTITPSFNGLSIKIHPAVGKIEGKRAYVGVFLPCSVLERKKDGGNEVSEQELPFLVTSMNELISADKKVLSQQGWRLAYRPVTLENRWSLESVKKFLNGETVDAAKVYDEVKQTWKTYIEFEDPTCYDLITLWIVGTYFFHLFNTYPYIYFGGIKRSGKTKALTLASTQAFNAIFSGNVSTSSVFRLIQSGRCSLLMDETEKLASPDRAQDFRSLLLSGYKKGGVVYRTEKTKTERFIPEAFEVFSPKMLANIQGIEDVLEDRCISLVMKRGKNKAILNREVDINNPYWQKIRDHLHILFLTHWKKVSELYESLGEQSEQNVVCEPTGSTLSGREYELWKPLLALAKFLDGHPQASQTTQTTLSSLILDLAKRKAEEKRIENMTETGDYILVQTLLSVVNEERYYKVKEIRDVMTKHFDEEQKWLNTYWVGRALKRLGFVDKRRVGTGYEYRLSKDAVKDLAERLGIETVEETKVCLDDLVEVVWSNEFHGEHECAICRCECLTSWQGTTNKGAKVAICENCQQEFEKRREST